MNEIYFAFIFGIIGTVMFHIGKSMQKHGIEFLEVIKKRFFSIDSSKKLHRNDLRKGLLYLTGITLNNSMAFWIMLANMFAPSSYFSSMFGIGLIPLLFYTKYFLNETITRSKWIGMFIVVAGTFALGIEGLHRARLSMSEINIRAVMTVISLYLAVSIVFLFAAYRSGNLARIGLSTGLFTGGLACIDPVLKGIGQHYGGTPGFFPSTPTGWIIFAISFIFSSASFLIAQLGFAKNTAVSIQVSTSTSVYICFPVIIMELSLPGYHITPLTIYAMMFVVGGIVLILGREKNQIAVLEEE